MTEGATLEGWAPEIGPGLSLAEVVDKAFDYRGNVTVVCTNGVEIELTGGGPHTITYREIRTIRFTGRDTAAGNSYAAWLRAKEAAKAASRSEKGSGSTPSSGV